SYNGLGNFAGFSFPHDIEKYRVSDTVYAFVTNANNHTLSRLKYASLVSQSVPSSTLSNPPAITFTAAGNYQVSLINNDTKYNKAIKCKSLHVKSGPFISISSSPGNVICEGNSTTLTVTGATNYTWEPGSITGSVIVVTPSVTTAYSVTADLPGACSSTASILVSVSPNPTISISTAPSIVCSGKGTTLTASGAGSYTWQPINSFSASISFSPSASSVFTVSGKSGNCLSDKVFTLNVEPTPTVSAVSTPTSICSNSNETVTLTATGASSYTWFPLSIIGSSVAVSPTISTLYTLVGSSSLGCLGANSVIVNVDPSPTLSIISSTNNICLGGNATFTVNGATTYTWLPSNNTTSIIVVTPTTSTTYTVSGNYNNGCIDSKTISLIVDPIPNYTVASTSNTICNGTSATLSATGSTSYTWYPGASNGSVIIVTPSITNIYTVSAANGGCIASKTISIDVIPSPIISIDPSFVSICNGETVQITGLGGVTYTWLPMGVNSNSISVSPSVTTSYTLIGSDSGCNGAHTATILVNNVPAVDIVGTSTSICLGDSVILSGSGANNYTWSPIPAINSSISVMPINSQFYYLFGESNGCFNKDSISIIVNPIPSIGITKTPNDSCVLKGTTVTLNVSGANSYTWLPFNSVSNSIDISMINSFSISVIADDTLGCKTTTNINIGIFPNMDFEISDSVVCLGETIDVNMNGVNSFTLLPDIISQLPIKFKPDVSSTYTLIGSEGTCTASSVFSIKVVEKIPIEFPEVFTPNDDGINDLFSYKGNLIQGIKLQVFNRWGNLVYKSDDYQNNWNGDANGKTLTSGKLPSGTYYYIAEVNNCDFEIIKGFVVIQY
ncbi:MAG: gliding motility-associated C-terminal domain-containing protein, partial [Bacteroidia bacterium]